MRNILLPGLQRNNATDVTQKGQHPYSLRQEWSSPPHLQLSCLLNCVFVGKRHSQLGVLGFATETVSTKDSVHQDCLSTPPTQSLRNP